MAKPVENIYTKWMTDYGILYRLVVPKNGKLYEYWLDAVSYDLVKETQWSVNQVSKRIKRKEQPYLAHSQHVEVKQDGRQKVKKVRMHKFIMIALHGCYPVISKGKRTVVMHLNDDSFDNRSTNLMFGTDYENNNSKKNYKKFSPILIYEIPLV